MIIDIELFIEILLIDLGIGISIGILIARLLGFDKQEIEK